MTEQSEALAKLFMTFGMEALNQLAIGLTPERVIERVTEVLKPQMKEAILELLSTDSVDESSIGSDLVDKFYNELDNDTVIEAIARPLAESLSTWFKENSGDLVIQIINNLDLDDITSQVVDKIAERLRVSTSEDEQ